MNTDQLLYGVAVVPAIVGLVQVAKEMGLPSHLAPGLAVALGILAGFAEVLGANWPPAQAVIVGIALGLSASGLYSGSSAIAAHLASTAGARPYGDPRHLQDVTPAAVTAGPAFAGAPATGPEAPVVAGPSAGRPPTDQPSQPAPPSAMLVPAPTTPGSSIETPEQQSGAGRAPRQP